MVGERRKDEKRNGSEMWSEREGDEKTGSKGD